MSNIAVAFDENAIGQFLTLSNSDTLLQIGSTCDAHRCARSQFGQGSIAQSSDDNVSVEFYLFSPLNTNPSLTGAAYLGVVLAGAAVNKYVGEDPKGWGLNLGDMKVYNNGAVVATFSGTINYNDYIAVIVYPAEGQITWVQNGKSLGTITVASGVGGFYFYAATISGGIGGMGVLANSGQFQSKYNYGTKGWLHKALGLVPFNVATESYINQSSDTVPNSVYPGDLDRMKSPVKISRSVPCWMHGASMPPQLGRATSVQLDILDPNGVYNQLLTADIRDQLVRFRRCLQGTSSDAAEGVFTAVIDRCEQTSDQTKTIYANDKIILLQNQLQRPIFMPNVDPSVAGKPWPIAWGICRTYTPSLWDSVNSIYALSATVISQIGFPRVSGKALAPGTYVLSADSKSIDLNFAPQGAFTIETSSYLSSFSTVATDYLGGAGQFNTNTGSSGYPTNWSGGKATWQSYFTLSSTDEFQLGGGTNPNNSMVVNNHGNMCWMQHNSIVLHAGRSYSFSIKVDQVPLWSDHGQMYQGSPLNGTGWYTIAPAQLLIGYQANRSSAWTAFATLQLTAAGTYIGVLTNTTTSDQPLTLAFLSNLLNQTPVGSSKFKLANIFMNELPAYQTNIPLNGPGLDQSLQNFLITYGPFSQAEYDSTGAAAVDTATGWVHGLYVSPDETPNVEACAQKFLASVGAQIYVGRDEKIHTFVLDAPENVGQPGCYYTSSSGSLTVTDFDGFLIPYPDLAENLTTRLSGGKNYNPLSESDFQNTSLTDVSLSLRKSLIVPFQWTVVAGVKLPTRYNHAMNAAPLESTFDVSSHGQASITRQCGLYNSPRNFYVGTVFTPIGRTIDIGQVWFVTYPVGNLITGRYLVVLGTVESPSEELTEVVFWGL